MITEVGLELDRADIDTRITRWIQQSIDDAFSTLQSKGLEAKKTLTTTEDVETVAVPDDFGVLLELRYTPGDGSGKQLEPLNAIEFFRRHADQTGSGYPYEYCLFAGHFYFSPIPSSAMTLTLSYKRASASVYTHTINFTDADGAAATGVQVYLDENAIEEGIGKLYFVSPTETDAKIKLVTADGHVHEVTLYHSATAATLGVAWYFNEDGSETSERNLFVSPTGQDCVVQTDSYRNHTHYIKFIDDDSAASTGVGIYLDEDATVKTQRLLFVSPTDTNGTSECVLSKDGSVPPFVDRYHEAIFLGAISRGLRYEKLYQESNALAAQAGRLLGQFQNADSKRGPASVPAKPFTTRHVGVWDALRNPEIDD